jgi:HEAT repeat protein
VSVLFAALSVLAAGARARDGVTPAKAAKTAAAPAREELRYDGQPFAYWRNYVLTELKPHRRVEGFKALVAFGLSGDADEAAAAITECIKQNGAKFAKLYDKQPDVADEAAGALCQIGRAAIPVAIDALTHSDQKVRVFAVEILGALREQLPPSGVAALIGAVHDKKRDVRIAAAMAVADVEPPQGSLTKLVPNTAERKAFINALIALAKPDLPELNEPGAADQGYLIQGHQAALKVLGMVGPVAGRAVATLRNVLTEHKSSSAREAAATSLGQIGTDAGTVVPALARALRDPEQQVRAAAARSLAAFGRKAAPAAQALREALRAVIPAQRGMAFPDPADALDCWDWSLRLDIACALGRIGEDASAVTPVFLDTFKTVNAEGRQHMLASIGQQGASAAVFVPALLQAYEQYPENRAGIATALGGIGPAAKDGLPLLKEAAQGNDAVLRAAAVAAVRKITRRK